MQVAASGRGRGYAARARVGAQDSLLLTGNMCSGHGVCTVGSCSCAAAGPTKDATTRPGIVISGTNFTDHGGAYAWTTDVCGGILVSFDWEFWHPSQNSRSLGCCIRFGNCLHQWE